MPFIAGDWVYAWFPGEEVPAVVLEVKDNLLVVQEEGTRRREELLATACRKR